MPPATAALRHSTAGANEDVDDHEVVEGEEEEVVAVVYGWPAKGMATSVSRGASDVPPPEPWSDTWPVAAAAGLVGVPVAVPVAVPGAVPGAALACWSAARRRT